MTDADRTLVAAALLSAVAAAVWARHVRALDPAGPARRVAELHTAGVLAVLTATLGGAALGLGYSRLSPAVATSSLAFGLGYVILGAVLLRLEPPDALRLGALALGAAALTVGVQVVRAIAFDAAMPPPVLRGIALYAGYIGGICWLVRRT